nr:MAG TPA: hypothetical protein [Caudoviricetes sp.]
MKTTILANVIYSVSLASLVMSYVQKIPSYGNLGFAVTWVMIVLSIFVLVLTGIISASDNDDAKKKIKSSFGEKTVLGKFVNGIKLAALFSALCFNDYVFTAVVYLFAIVIFNIVRSSHIDSQAE